MADPPIQEAPGNGGASEIARLVRRRVSTRSDECCEQRVGGDGVMCASQRCGDAPDFLEQVPPLVSFTPVTGHGAWSRCQGIAGSAVGEVALYAPTIAAPNLDASAGIWFCQEKGSLI